VSSVAPLLALVVLVAVPLAMQRLDGGRSRTAAKLLALVRWGLAPASVLAAFSLAAGPSPEAAGLTGPWLVMAGACVVVAGLRFLADPDRLRPGSDHAVLASCGYLLVGAVALAANRMGAGLLGFGEPLVLLTAVHFHTAGFVLLVAGAEAWRARPTRWLELGLVAVVVGTPLTALGFFGLPPLNWAGAVLVAGGGLLIGFGHLAAAGRVAGPARWLLRLAGVALLCSMPLAAAYATANVAGIAGPDLELMARVHGTVNVLGFAIPATAGWVLALGSARLGGQPRRSAFTPASRVGVATGGLLMLAAPIAIAAGLDPRAGGWQPASLVAVACLPGLLVLVAVVRGHRPLAVAAGMAGVIMGMLPPWPIAIGGALAVASGAIGAPRASVEALRAMLVTTGLAVAAWLSMAVGEDVPSVATVALLAGAIAAAAVLLRRPAAAEVG
jgi:hypothetical protein